MSNEYPSSGGFTNEPQKDNKNTYIIILLIALIASWIYIFYAKNKTNTIIIEKDAQYSTLDSTKNAVQKEYDDAMTKLNDMTLANAGLDSLVKTKNSELQVLKSKFKSLVGKQNATSKDLAEAKSLVSELNTRINDYVKEIERLQAENQQLTVDKANLTTDKQNLQKNLTNTETAKKDAEGKVDVGSTLHASNFQIIAINETGSGKEKATSRAKRADKFRISFNLDENRIAVTGTKLLYIIAKDPAGKVIKEDALGSGSINTRQDGAIDFTAKIESEYTQGQLKPISFDLRQADKITKGSYSIIVYQNGFKIGEGVAILK